MMESYFPVTYLLPSLGIVIENTPHSSSPGATGFSSAPNRSLASTPDDDEPQGDRTLVLKRAGRGAY